MCLLINLFKLPDYTKLYVSLPPGFIRNFSSEDARLELVAFRVFITISVFELPITIILLIEKCIYNQQSFFVEIQ